ncbi:unnamed protein product [Discosporangium mesarthrocarpum]
MAKKLLARVGIAAIALALSAGSASAAYDTNATSVVSTVVTTTQTTATTSTVTTGFTGGGGTSSMFTPGGGGGGGGGGTPGVDTNSGSLMPTGRGLSAGGKEGRLAVWVNAGYSYFDEDQEALDSDGTAVALAAGGDWRFSERVIGGLSVGYQYSDVNTTFNQGKIESDGFFVAPYIAVEVTNNIFVDGTVGYTFLGNDADRISGGTKITGSYDSSTVFGTANVTGNIQRGRLTIQPGVGVLYTRQKSDSYTESNGGVIPSNTATLGRLRAGARLQYQVTNALAPFVRGDIEYDFKHDDITVGAGQTQPSYHDTGGVLGAGMVMNLSDRMRASVEGSTVVGKSDFSQYNLSANLRFSF